MNFGQSGPLGIPRINGDHLPRLWTPPLRELTPETSYGFDVVDFADTIIGEPLDPWQEWAAIHLGELLPDGRPRFRHVVIIVARQQGKSHLARALTLFWMFIERWPLTLGLNATLGYAKEQWSMVCATATENEWLAAELAEKPIRSAAGEECLTTARRCRYKIAAANRRAGRSLTIDRIIADELREQQKWDIWNSASNAMNARPNAQLVAITSQGDDESVVLNGLRRPALDYIETGEGNYRLGLFEWSATAGSSPTDLDALAMANPNLVHPNPARRTDPEALIGSAQTAQSEGGSQLTGFLTEVMCIKVDTLNPAISVDAWNAAASSEPMDLAQHRKRVALCLDVSLDGRHASLIAAATIEDVTHIDVVAAWSGPRCLTDVARELPALVRKVKPRVIGWFPAGPAAALAADLQKRRTSGGVWPPTGVKVEPITTDTPAVCMALPALLSAGQIGHSGDPMLTSHVRAAQRLNRGDGRWVYQRAEAGSIDGAYAAAGAVHLARTLPPPPAPFGIIRI